MDHPDERRDVEDGQAGGGLDVRPVRRHVGALEDESAHLGTALDQPARDPDVFLARRLDVELQEIVQQDAVWSFGYFPTSAAAYQQWIYNGKPTQIVRNHISYLRLDPELRARKIAEWNRPVWWPIPLLAIALLAGILPAWRAWRRRERETAARTLAREGA